ncbi:MAG: hypothetical protein ACK4YU_01125 [Paracoccus sp. (in: a-proteobacteria)]
MSEHNFPKGAMLAEHAVSPKPWGALTHMLLVQIAATSSILSLTALAPAAAQTLGVGAHWIGYQISFIYFAGTFASLCSGTLVARWSAERVITVEFC